MVSIRFVEEKDASFVQKYASNEEVAKTCLLPHPYPEHGGKQWVEFAMRNRKKGKGYSFSIIYKGLFAGVISLTNIASDKGSCNLGYWLGKPFWNQGITTNAVFKSSGVCFR